MTPATVARDAWAVGRFLRTLRGYLQQTLRPEDCPAQIRRQLERRGESFLFTVEAGIFANEHSPYLALMRQAGVELGDLQRIVRQDGVEAALDALWEAGVRVSLDEFKGRKPILRSTLSLQPRARDFDNPLILKHFEVTTGGTRGRGSRLIIDLNLVAYEAAHTYLSLQGLDAVDRPAALWRPVPPASIGMKVVLQHARLDRMPRRWFSQTSLGWGGGRWRHNLFTLAAIQASRLWGCPLPRPEHVPPEHAVQVVRWIADQLRRGRPPLIDTNVAAAVRLSLVAADEGIDIAGSLFRTSGEPLTDARAGCITSTGSRVAANYGIAEAGRLAMACADPVATDDVHLFLDKVGLLQKPRIVDPSGRQVDALHLTTIHPATPKLMLNVEVGDSAVRLKRRCACPFGAVGLDTHLHTIRSYEKLTTLGMHFLGTELLFVVEKLLPQRFGGGPLDYQLAETDVDGMPRVEVVVSPRVGPIDERAVTACILDALARPEDGHQMMVDRWRQENVLEVVRRDPYATPAAKVQALHVHQPQANQNV